MVKILFGAVKEVIANGKLVNIDNKHNGKQIDTCILAEKIFDGKTHYIVGVALKQSEAGNDTSYYYHDSAIIEIATAAGLAKKATATRVGNLTSSNNLIMSVLLNIAKRNGQSGQSVRNSLSDEDYMDAVEREDMETAARMVEEAAKDAGQIEIVRSKH